MRARTAAVLILLVAPSLVGAQASPFLALDDPRLAFIEHLHARGDLTLPDLFKRPWTIRELRQALAATPDGDVASALAARLRPVDEGGRFEARAGFQSFTRARRDLLQPAGPGGTRPYLDLGGVVASGIFAAGVRVAWEPRLKLDPDWVDSTSVEPRTREWRLPEAYATLAAGPVRITVGQVARQLGPMGLSGLPLGNEAYPRPELSLEARVGPFRAQAIGGSLRQVVGAIRPERSRSYTIHRLAVSWSPALEVGLWEAGLLTSGGSELGLLLLSPLQPVLGRHLFSSADDMNVMFGVDLAWRPSPGFRVEAQGALDDVGSDGGDGARRPARWAATLGGAGAIGQDLSWRAVVTAASSLVYRTIRPEEYHTDGGIGLGRNSGDQLRATLSLGIPMQASWLLSPTLAWQRQGEGRLDQPFPPIDQLAAIPALLIGTPATSWQAGLRVAGIPGPLAIQGYGGVSRVTNPDNIPGTGSTRFEAWLQATVGFSLGGSFH